MQTVHLNLIAPLNTVQLSALTASLKVISVNIMMSLLSKYYIFAHRLFIKHQIQVIIYSCLA